MTLQTAVDRLLEGEILIDFPASFLERVWEVHDPYEFDRWITGIVECRMCGDKHLSSWPHDILDETRQECPECEHMTCEPVTDDLFVYNE